MRRSKFWEPFVGLAAMITIPLLFVEEQLTPTAALTINTVIWGVFTTAFVSTLFACVNKAERRSLLKVSVLDLLIILGSFPVLPGALQSLRILRVGRAARLVRLMRLGRVFALGWLLRWAKSRFSLNPILFSGTVAVIAIFVGANAFHILEPDVAPSLGTSLWWAITTVSTVGYGDISPSTPEGRFVGVCLMVVGVGAMAGFSGALASYLMQHPGGNEHSDSKSLSRVLAELQLLREQLARLEESRDEKRTPSP